VINGDVGMQTHADLQGIVVGMEVWVVIVADAACTWGWDDAAVLELIAVAHNKLPCAPQPFTDQQYRS
jgi:hypothetical protein